MNQEWVEEYRVSVEGHTSHPIPFGAVCTGVGSRNGWILVLFLISEPRCKGGSKERHFVVRLSGQKGAIRPVSPRYQHPIFVRYVGSTMARLSEGTEPRVFHVFEKGIEDAT